MISELYGTVPWSRESYPGCGINTNQPIYSLCGYLLPGWWSYWYWRQSSVTVRIASTSMTSGLDCRKVEYWLGSKWKGWRQRFGAYQHTLPTIMVTLFSVSNKNILVSIQKTSLIYLILSKLPIPDINFSLTHRLREINVEDKWWIVCCKRTITAIPLWCLLNIPLCMKLQEEIKQKVFQLHLIRLIITNLIEDAPVTSRTLPVFCSCFMAVCRSQSVTWGNSSTPLWMRKHLKPATPAWIMGWSSSCKGDIRCLCLLWP